MGKGVKYGNGREWAFRKSFPHTSNLNTRCNTGLTNIGIDRYLLLFSMISDTLLYMSLQNIPLRNRMRSRRNYFLECGPLNSYRPCSAEQSELFQNYALTRWVLGSFGTSQSFAMYSFLSVIRYRVHDLSVSTHCQAHPSWVLVERWRS